MDTSSNPVPSDIPGLVAQARAAYQQTRFKECLALTKSLLQIDPSNPAAIQLQSAIRADMQRDLADARLLLEDSRHKQDGQKYRKAAEIILVKALMLDPDNEGAKTLLTSARSSSSDPIQPSASTPPAVSPSASAPSAMLPSAYPTTASPAVAVLEAPPVIAPVPLQVIPRIVSEPERVFVPAAAPVPQVQTAKFESPVYDYVPPPEHRRHPDEIGFTTGTAAHAVKPAKAEKRPSLTIPIAVVLVAVLGGGFLLVRQRYASSSNSTPASPAQAANVVPNAQQPPSGAYPIPPKAASAPALNTQGTANTAAPPKLVAAANAPPAIPAATNATTSASAAPPVRPNTTTAGATGSLAVNSSISAEIYFGDKYLGSTPTTLQLPAGSQTVEYRHSDLRAVVTHVIKPNETTTANITFDATVQVNARPWAQVYVEGVQRVPLGQTPLSNVKLPIGSVLVFENPNFPSKSHKIAADDKTIQMVFQ
jgi:hypothetical protein